MSPTELLLDGTARGQAAIAMVLAYGVLCAWVIWRHYQRSHPALQTLDTNRPQWLGAFASQTGTAEALALHAAQRLEIAGMATRLLPLDALTLPLLQACERLLLVVSTYGDGNAPDNGSGFETAVMSAQQALPDLHYGVLALGDRSYDDYCAFGRRLDGWLAASSAQALFPRIEVDAGHAPTLALWQQHLGHLAGSSDAPDWQAPAFEPWQLLSRTLLNPGSAGAPLYELRFVPASGLMPQWSSGDLVQIVADEDPGRPRDYSIASLHQEGVLQLIVRLYQDEDGRLGTVSSWLTQTLAIGDSVQARIRPHRLFRLDPAFAGPLLLIGNGSGLAGLMGHLKARIRDGLYANWLMFGERNIATDNLYSDTLEAWKAQGKLQALDRTFSRDAACGRYIQDLLAERSAEVLGHVTAGGAIYVCGSLQGMASGVESALQKMLGEPALKQLRQAGRYRRDVY